MAAPVPPESAAVIHFRIGGGYNPRVAIRQRGK
jgi:hypothetical protein